MSFFSVKESVRYPADLLNTFERLEGGADCILNDLLDFPQCSLEIHSEDIYSLESTFKAETDPWSNPKFDTTQTTHFRYSSDDKVDGSSIESSFTCFSADSLPEESNFRDSILQPYEMPVSDDFHSLVMNTSTVDVLDYPEDLGSSFNLTSKSASYYNYWEHDTLLLRSECDGEAETNPEHPNERNLCYSPTRSFPSTNSHNWSTDNTYLECTSHRKAQCNTCDISGTFDKNEIVEKPEAYFECNGGTSWTDWSLKSQQEEKGLPVEQFATTYTASSTETTFTTSLIVKETVSLLNTSTFYMTSGDGSSNWPINENMNIEELSGLHSGSKSGSNTINNNNNDVEPVNQRNEAEHVLLGESTACPLGPAYQGQIPFSGEMYTDLHNLISECSNMKTTTPLTNAAFRELDETGTINVKKGNSERIDGSSCSKLSQTNSQINDINRVAIKEKKYMKVGKRGRFVTVPVGEVNKLMVRDLLIMSGNREEMSIKDSTQEYRNNIRKMLEQKRKRLNVV